MAAEIYRIEFTQDKLGRDNGVIYYYKVEFGHRVLIQTLLRDYPLKDDDTKMLRRLLRVGDYSEIDRDRLQALRRKWMRDQY